MFRVSEKCLKLKLISYLSIVLIICICSNILCIIVLIFVELRCFDFALLMPADL